MEKVYVVWYKNTELNKIGIWGIFSDSYKAEEAAARIEADWGCPAWWNEEMVE